MCIVFRKASEAKGVEMGEDGWCSNWEDSSVYHEYGGEMKYGCVVGGSEAGIKCKNLVLSAHAYSRLWVFSNMFLKEVSLPLKADISIHANGLPTLKCLWHPRVTMTRSAQRT